MEILATTPEISVDIDGEVARVVLSRPESLNALSSALLLALVGISAELNKVPGLKVVVISGEGRAFTAGADLGEFTALGGDARDSADLGRRMAEAVESIEAVTVAQIHGYCIGGGVVLAAACDIRVAANDTIFCIPELELGIPLAWGGIPRLIREIGPAATKDLVLTCRRFTAEEAQSLGFITRVVPCDGLAAEIATLTRTLCARSNLTLRSTVRAVDAITNAMVGTFRSQNDADALVGALHDPESREVAATYLSSRGH